MKFKNLRKMQPSERVLFAQKEPKAMSKSTVFEPTVDLPFKAASRVENQQRFSTSMLKSNLKYVDAGRPSLDRSFNECTTSMMDFEAILH